MNINLQIERLILDGVDLPAGQRADFQTALETELARLLAARGLAPGLASGVALPVIRAGDLQLKPGHSPAELGQSIAQAVYGGIGR